MPILGCWTLIVTGSVFGEQVNLLLTFQQGSLNPSSFIEYALMPEVPHLTNARVHDCRYQGRNSLLLERATSIGDDLFLGCQA